jgi:hypothetical protein
MTYLATIRKALMAGGFAGAAALGASMLDGDLTRPEAVIAVGMALTGAVATWRIPNAEAGK